MFFELQKDTSTSQSRQANQKRKTVVKRQARIFNVPDDVMSNITSKKPAQPASPQLSPHLSPSSVPTSFMPSPQSSGFPPVDMQNQTFQFNDYVDHPVKPNSNTVIVKNIPRDINEAVEEIIVMRPPAPVMPKNDISYVCPFSSVPITCPGRGVFCNHSQCFDMREFILSQIDDNWTCPICNMPIDYDQLRFDPYFFKKTSVSNIYIPQQPMNQAEEWNEFGFRAE